MRLPDIFQLPNIQYVAVANLIINTVGFAKAVSIITTACFNVTFVYFRYEHNYNIFTP